MDIKTTTYSTRSILVMSVSGYNDRLFMVVDTVMTDDTVPYIMVSADPGIEIAQIYDLVVS